MHGDRLHRPPKGPWTPFGPFDDTPLDVDGVMAGVKQARTRLEKTRTSIERLRRGGADEPPPDDRHPRPDTAPRRADELMPFLLIRAFPGDIGARPIDPNLSSTASPDILTALPLPAGSAPEPAIRDRAQFPDQSFTSRLSTPQQMGTYDVWVHVWNLGRAPAYGVRVRAWAQAVGVQSAPGDFLGGRRIDLGDRTSETSHRVVKIGQVLWGNGYDGLWANAECLTDVSLGTDEDVLMRSDQWGAWVDASKDRHTAFVDI